MYMFEDYIFHHVMRNLALHLPVVIAVMYFMYLTTFSTLVDIVSVKLNCFFMYLFNLIFSVQVHSASLGWVTLTLSKSYG